MKYEVEIPVVLPFCPPKKTIKVKGIIRKVNKSK